MNRKQLLKQYKKKKFGGNTRSFIVDSVIESDNLAFINEKAIGPKLKFLGVYIMQKTNGSWQLKDEYLILEPIKKS